jgi:hypothetical protein
MDNAEQAPWRLIVGPLVKVYADRIIVGSETVLFVRPGTTCEYEPGTIVRVTYVDRGGWLDMVSISLMEGPFGPRIDPAPGR